MIVRDEADIIEHTVRHLQNQVDHVVVVDNLSTDGTAEIAADLGVSLFRDDDPAHYQGQKMTRWAHWAMDAGHQWFLPCDADEVFYVPDGRPLTHYLIDVPSAQQIVFADSYPHIPTAADPEDRNPIRRIEWRRPVPDYAKIVCRLRPGLVIGDGNHWAELHGSRLLGPSGLELRHFSWRSPDQYVRKIRNGCAALALTDLPPSAGHHWRLWQGRGDDEIREYFMRERWSDDPRKTRWLVHDPAPVYGPPRRLRRAASVSLQRLANRTRHYSERALGRATSTAETEASPNAA